MVREKEKTISYGFELLDKINAFHRLMGQHERKHKSARWIEFKMIFVIVSLRRGYESSRNILFRFFLFINVLYVFHIKIFTG